MITASVTSKNQTTIPKGVREALEIHPGDILEYELTDGAVIVRRAGDEKADPAVAAFLDFLAKDMIKHPYRLERFPNATVRSLRALIRSTAPDYDESIQGPVSL